MMNTKLAVSLGALEIVSGGILSDPSHVYSLGIEPPSEKAEEKRRMGEVYSEQMTVNRRR
jgi:hypothetical protein